MNSTNTNTTVEASKKYKAVIETNSFSRGLQHTLYVSHNFGHSYTGISIDDPITEIPVLIEVLSEFLKSLK